MIIYYVFVEYNLSGNRNEFPNLDSVEASEVFKISKNGKHLVDTENKNIADICPKDLAHQELISISKNEYMPVISSET